MKHTWNDKPIQPEDTPWLQEDGVYKVYYDTEALRASGQVSKGDLRSGALRYEGPYVNGQLHGVRKGYYLSGALWYEIPYVNGQLHGVHKRYSESGALMYEYPYVNDQRRDDLKDNRLAQVVLFGVEE